MLAGSFVTVVRGKLQFAASDRTQTSQGIQDDRNVDRSRPDDPMAAAQSPAPALRTNKIRPLSAAELQGAALPTVSAISRVDLSIPWRLPVVIHDVAERKTAEAARHAQPFRKVSWIAGRPASVRRPTESSERGADYARVCVVAAAGLSHRAVREVYVVVPRVSPRRARERGSRRQCWATPYAVIAALGLRRSPWQSAGAPDVDRLGV